MPFRLNAKNIFLTYSQATTISKDDIFNHIQSVLSDRLSWCVIGHEHHQDGNSHFHAIIGLSSKYNCRNERLFDVAGFHPKIEPSRDVFASIRYVSKEDTNVLRYGTIPSPKRKWAEVLEADDRESAITTIKAVSARDWIINHERIEYFLDKRFKPTVPEYVNTYEFNNLPNVIHQWLEQRLNTDRPKSLILWGPSRTRKTSWARSVGPHMYFNGMFDLSNWNPDAQYAVFDDWEDWTKFFGYKQWLGAQKEFTITDKYRKKMTVSWGKPCIICSNELPNFLDKDWISLNCFIIKINSLLT